MIRSMTAYARKENKGIWGTASWELRSVNQRYLETNIRLPEQFRSLEGVVRERLRARLTRGKVDAILRFEANSEYQSGLTFNRQLAEQLIQAAQWVKQCSQEGEINPVDILRWPGVMETKEQDIDVLAGDLLTLLDETIDDFLATREREGAVLKELITQRLTGVAEQVAMVRNQMPSILQWQRERLQNKLADAQLDVDLARFEQEMVFLAQKIDVEEELDRLSSHIKETQAILNMPEVVGRRLDFMMQEFNREANTLASKSINADVTKSAVELKVLIEQMREQIQNIE